MSKVIRYIRKLISHQTLYICKNRIVLQEVP